MAKIEIDLSQFYEKTAKIKDLENYLKKVLDIAKEGNDITITGNAPIWLYLKVAHTLHGKARKLIYKSPVIGEIEIFDHSAE